MRVAKCWIEETDEERRRERIRGGESAGLLERGVQDDKDKDTRK